MSGDRQDVVSGAYSGQYMLRRLTGTRFDELNEPIDHRDLEINSRVTVEVWQGDATFGGAIRTRLDGD
jgi:hypothetical protein